MPKKVKKIEEHLEIIENLLVGILLDRKPSVKELAKIVGISDRRITEMYPEPSEGRRKGPNQR
jgi:hypothetical protein